MEIDMKYEEFKKATKLMDMGSEYEYAADWKTVPLVRVKFEPEWEVVMLPPKKGAAFRFLVYGNGKQVSVYYSHGILCPWDGKHFSIFDGEREVILRDNFETVSDVIREMLI
jgi:hypothetical protein